MNIFYKTFFEIFYFSTSTSIKKVVTDDKINGHNSTRLDEKEF